MAYKTKYDQKKKTAKNRVNSIYSEQRRKKTKLAYKTKLCLRESNGENRVNSRRNKKTRGPN